MKTFDERRKSVESHMKTIRRRRAGAAAASVTAVCLVLVVSMLAVYLFTPYNTQPPSVEQYADSPYYPLIEKLNAATYTPPAHKNPFEAIMYNLIPKKSGEINGTMNGTFNDYLLMTGTMAGATPEESAGYVEVTDNQVSGVIEADIFKRSSEHLYYLSGNVLRIFTIDQDASCQVGGFELKRVMLQADQEDEYDHVRLFRMTDMYLSQDCSTVTVIGVSYHPSLGYCTEVISLDVSDPSHISEKNRAFFTGEYISSRMVDGQLLLLYSYSVKMENINFDDPATFVPQYGTKENMQCVPSQQIICPDAASVSRYTVVCSVSEQTGDVQDSVALVGYSYEVYVSQDTIFATYAYTKRQQQDETRYTKSNYCDITGVAYGGGSLEILGTISLEGYVKNQYCMDAYNGVLRVVTNTFSRLWQEYNDGDTVSVAMGASKKNVNLYCVDLSSWEVVASVEAFAPEGESAESVRFDGHMAYVCTAEVIINTDPVYFFDLSDLKNITWTDTGTIDGYSTSLIQLKDGYLLGIGYGDERQLKLEIYKEQDGQVISVATYQRDAFFAEEYKSYLIDRENQLFGLAIADYVEGGQYVLLHFDGENLYEVMVMENYQYSSLGNARAVIIDGWLYVLGKQLTVSKVF